MATSVSLPLQASPQIEARIHGEPWTQLPRDLYIPPDALAVYLDTFEGPLDLLLYLIRQHNLDILDIPMAQLTQQYMQYVEQMRIEKLALAADYLLMSAMLIEIKSRMLLPKPSLIVEQDDPRAELVRRLLEYEAIKLAAEKLDQMPQVGVDIQVAQAYWERMQAQQLPQVSMDDLIQAWQQVIQRAKHFTHHQISRAGLSVRAHMSQIMRQLQQQAMMEFHALFDVQQDGIPKLVVCFLAILELAREGLIQITQQGAYSPIYVQRT